MIFKLSYILFLWFELCGVVWWKVWFYDKYVYWFKVYGWYLCKDIHDDLWKLYIMIYNMFLITPQRGILMILYNDSLEGFYPSFAGFICVIRWWLRSYKAYIDGPRERPHMGLIYVVMCPIVGDVAVERSTWARLVGGRSTVGWASWR